jgi:hypothetical protein
VDTPAALVRHGELAVEDEPRDGEPDGERHEQRGRVIDTQGRRERQPQVRVPGHEEMQLEIRVLVRRERWGRWRCKWARAVLSCRRWHWVRCDTRGTRVGGRGWRGCWARQVDPRVGIRVRTRRRAAAGRRSRRRVLVVHWSCAE